MRSTRSARARPRSFERARTQNGWWRASGAGLTARATLVAYPGERPVLAGRLKITARYFRVSGFAFRSNGTEEAIVWVAARNVEVSMNEIHDGTTSCLFGGGDRVRVVSNWIHDCGTHHVNGLPQDHGIYWTGGNDSLIANNVIERAFGFGIQVHPYTPSNARNVIRDNTILSNGRLTGGNLGASGIILDGTCDYVHRGEEQRARLELGERGAFLRRGRTGQRRQREPRLAKPARRLPDGQRGRRAQLPAQHCRPALHVESSSVRQQAGPADALTAQRYDHRAPLCGAANRRGLARTFCRAFLLRRRGVLRSQALAVEPRSRRASAISSPTA